jgi:biopolymer transport protein ExbD
MSIQQRSKPSIDFSLASMADLVFLLLIFFILTLSVNQQLGLKVDLPQTSTQLQTEGKNTVTITKDLRFSWNAEEIQKEEIPALIQQVLTDENETNNVITLRTDREVQMQEAAFVMSHIAKFGGKVVIATEKVTP